MSRFTADYSSMENSVKIPKIESFISIDRKRGSANQCDLAGLQFDIALEKTLVLKTVAFV